MYSLSIDSIEKKLKVILRISPKSPSGLRENIVDVVMEVKFIINIHAQVFNRMGPGYRGLT
jgi:hypothetical protein